MASGFPLLPGFVPTQEFKEHYRKVSAGKQEANRDLNGIEPTRYPLPREKQFSEPRFPAGALSSTSHDHFQSKTGHQETGRLVQPDWIRLDRHVLRFYGYFQEAVVESNSENSRNRKVKVLFYLEDNSVSINEEKQGNSGIPQGIFLKREKCLRSDGSGKFLTAYDFRLCQPILIHGRNIYLYDCDQYTREFYENLGEPQGPPEQYSNDEWTETKQTKWIPQKDAMMKEYLEKKLGGGRVTSQKQFLENDRKVLKFYAKSGAAQFIIHYFLADDTIEIREMQLPNSGKDPFPVTFRRQKLPFKFALNQPGQTYAEDFLKADQLQVGATINVFGTNYALEGCDQFTHDYYLAVHGQDMPMNSSGSSEKAAPRSNIIIPPHNGIGSEEDSLGYIYKLVPKAPKKDFFKWVDQQVSLRFNAVFAKPKPEDVHRRFIITYYLNDDSLQIYESQTRNSGFSEGKFLERGQYKDPEGKTYLPEHMVVGRNVLINGYLFHFTDCDDFTKRWYADNTTWEPNV